MKLCNDSLKDILLATNRDCTLCNVMRWVQNYLAFKLGVIIGAVLLRLIHGLS
jgi:hypothetical protein